MEWFTNNISRGLEARCWGGGWSKVMALLDLMSGEGLCRFFNGQFLFVSAQDKGEMELSGVAYTGGLLV